MLAALAILLGLGVYNSDAMSEFREHSNHNPHYVISFVEDCQSGLRSSGYAYAPSGSIMLKQVNKDGSIGDVCSD
jgi:hypothetical protein